MPVTKTNPRIKTKNLQFLRNSNRAAIIKELALKNASNRMEISAHLGLSKMAISGLVNELIHDGYIKEHKFLPDKNTPKSSGRNPTSLIIPLGCINAISIHIKRYEIHCMIIDINGEILYHDLCPIPEGTDNHNFILLLTALIEKAIKQNSTLYFSGIGIASIGPLDIFSKRLLFPPDFFDIGNLCLGEILEEHFHIPVCLDNDMNASAIAEHFYGKGHQTSDLVYIGFGSGVGAGVMMNGKLLHGNGGFAGEIGHVSINPNGPNCSCGQKGCLEIYTSISNLLKNAGVSTTAELTKLLSQDSPPRYILQCINECQEALHSMLVTVANMYDPEIIIFGEIPPELNEVYFQNMEGYVNDHMFHRGFQNIRLHPSSFGENTALMGAASMIFQKIFSGEFPIPEHKDTDTD